MSQRKPTVQRSPIHRILVVGIFLSLLCLAALPASAATIVSTMKTGIINVLPDQSLAIAVTDLAVINTGSKIKISIFDGDGTLLRQRDEYLSAGKTIGLRVRGSEIPNASPAHQLRAEIEREWEVGGGSITITNIEVVDPGGLATNVNLSCGGPAARDPETEFTGDCPGVAQNGHVFP